MARLGQFRRDTAANWEASNPIIADGEFILIATDPAKPRQYDAQKVGDGVTRYKDLPMRGYECTQETGDSTLIPMSQKATTEKLSELESEINDIAVGLSKNIAIGLKGSYVQFELKEVISRNVYGSYIFLVNFKDITNNQVVFTIGDNDNKIYSQLISGVLKLHYIDGNGNRVTSGLSYVNLGWNKLCLKIREGNVAGPVLELIVNDSNYALSTQSFQWDEINYAVITLGALNSGLLPTNASFAALLSSINGNNVNYYAEHFVNNTNGDYQLEIVDFPIADNSKYPYSLPIKRDSICSRLNGTTSFLTYENRQGIVVTDGKVHFKFKVPTDIQPNQILFAWGNQLMVTLNEGYLQFYNAVTQSLSFPMQNYIDKVITLSLIKKKGNLDVLIDDVQVKSIATSVNATDDIQTLSIGSYDGGAALFSAIDFYEITKTDLQNNIEWTINPFTKPSTIKDVSVLVGEVNLSESKSAVIDYFANIPQNIYLTNGLQYNLYIENIIHGYEKLGYQLELKNPNGNRNIRSMERNIRFEVKNLGTQSVNLTLYDASGKVLQSENRNLVITNVFAGSGVKQFLFCGDSTIDDATTGVYEHEGPEIVKQFYENCNTYKGFTPLMVGTKRNFPPYYHEGNTGQASSWYIGTSSPFYKNGKIDFNSYMQSAIQGISGAVDAIDFFVYQIGINDLKNEGSPMSVINNIKTLVAALLADYPNCKIILGMPASGCDADGWSLHFGDVSRYEVFRNNMIEYQKLLLENFADGVYADNVYVCNAGHFVDRIYGFPYAEENESSRINVKVMRHIDSVHPNKGGYGQMADAYFAMVKALM